MVEGLSNRKDSLASKSRASSPLVKVFLDTRILRVPGRRLFPVYMANLPTSDRILLRSKFDWDAATVNEVHGSNIYEKKYSLSEGDVVVDVGAHIGSFTLKAAHQVGSRGRVVGVEPYSQNYELLTRNVALNSYHNVTLVSAGLGSAARSESLNIYQRAGQNSF